MRYQVRRTRVLRISETTTSEVDAETEAEAIELAQDDDGWIEDDRETLLLHAQARPIDDMSPPTDD